MTSDGERIFIVRDGQQLGPFGPQQLRVMRDAGEISSRDLAWREGLREWTPLSQLIGESQPPPIPTTISGHTTAKLPPPIPQIQDQGKYTSASLPNDTSRSAGDVGRSKMKTAPDYFSWDSRIGRADFFIRISAHCLAFSIVFAATLHLEWAFPALKTIWTVIFLGGASFFFYVSIVQAGKRLHDWNASAAWLLVLVTGGGSLILPILLLAMPGNSGPNRFGARQPSSRRMRMAAWIIGGVWLLAMCGAVIITSLTGTSVK